MTGERARDIIKQAQEKANEKGYPWVDLVSKIMTPEERKEVVQVWDKMDGNTCFMDALTKISKQYP